MTPALARWRRRTDLPLLILAIGSLPVLVLEVMRNELIALDRRFLDVLNLVVLVAFAADYFIELALARDRRAYVRHEWTSALIVITQAIAVAPTLGGFGVFRVLRAGPVLRALVVAFRVVAVGGFAAREGRQVIRRHAASFALGLAAFTWILSAVLFTIVEDVGRGRTYTSFFDALWWSLGTLTTVGYGEVYPRTGEGRFVAAFTIVVGLATLATITAKVAEFLVRTDLEDSSGPTPTR